MRRIKTIKELRRVLSGKGRRGGSCGFVPTMGCFHDGHLSLMRRCRKDNLVAVASVFVNPVQFGEDEDFIRYPRDPESDARAAGAEGLDVLFEPEVSEMYPEGYGTFVEVEGLSGLLCGKTRPAHFRGVATVVAKLLNIVRPDVLYLGQKDAQQAVILRKMARDLDFGVKVEVLPTVREEDGLAMSSRNRYLSEEERKAAPLLYRALSEAKRVIGEGAADSAAVRKKCAAMIESEKKFRLEYFEIVDPEDLRPAARAEGRVLVAAAARLGNARLIDNIMAGGGL